MEKKEYRHMTTEDVDDLRCFHRFPENIPVKSNYCSYFSDNWLLYLRHQDYVWDLFAHSEDTGHMVFLRNIRELKDLKRVYKAITGNVCK